MCGVPLVLETAASQMEKIQLQSPPPTSIPTTLEYTPAQCMMGCPGNATITVNVTGKLFNRATATWSVGRLLAAVGSCWQQSSQPLVVIVI